MNSDEMRERLLAAGAKQVSKPLGDQLPEGESIAIVCGTVVPGSMPSVPGATTDACIHCKVQVWVAPSSREMIDKYSGIIMCINCAAKQAENDPDFHVNELLPSQQMELLNHGGEEVLDFAKKFTEKVKDGRTYSRIMRALERSCYRGTGHDPDRQPDTSGRVHRPWQRPADD